MTPTANPEIHVYASFPRAVALGADFNLDADNWHWVLCLTIPLDTLKLLEFTPRPFKWIRYAIGIVVGAEGHLSHSRDSCNIVDYNAGLSAESIALYYFTSDDERRRMFPVDPKIAGTNLTTSTANTERAVFRSEVAERDGNRCVLTGMQEILCGAAHLLAHTKSNMDIRTYTQRRSRDPTGGDIVQDINDVRNGLFLNRFTHAGSGKYVAFLPTPNFAMNTADVDPTAPPAEKRYTAHLFKPDFPHFFGSPAAPTSPTPIRMSDSPDWPPDILFDAVYASVILHYFGTQTLKDEVSATWTDAFYHSEAMNQTHTARSERAEIRAQKRQARHDARAVPDTFDMLLALPYVLVPKEQLQTTLREAKEKAEVAEKRRVQEKVNAWNSQVISL